MAIKVGSSPKVKCLIKGSASSHRKVKASGGQPQARQLKGEMADVQGTADHLVTGGAHNIRTRTCQGLDAGALKEACRAVLIVPVVHVPAVVHVAVLLLDLNVVIVCGYRGRHLGCLSCLSTSVTSQSSGRKKGKAWVCIQSIQPL